MHTRLSLTDALHLCGTRTASVLHINVVPIIRIYFALTQIPNACEIDKNSSNTAFLLGPVLILVGAANYVLSQRSEQIHTNNQQNIMMMTNCYASRINRVKRELLYLYIFRVSRKIFCFQLKTVHPRAPYVQLTQTTYTYRDTMLSTEKKHTTPSGYNWYLGGRIPSDLVLISAVGKAYVGCHI